MKHGIILSFVLITVLILLCIPTNQGTIYKRASNKIYTSVLDKDLVVIAPNDNDTLAYHATYQFYLIETNNKNFTVWYNWTIPITYKDNLVKAVISSFYVNDSSFTISVTEGNNNATSLLTIHYIAKTGFVPWPEPTPMPEPEPVNITQPWLGYTPKELGEMAGEVVIIAILALFIMGFTIKRVKEHRTVETDEFPAIEYYRWK